MNIFKPLFIKIADILILIISAIFSVPSIVKNSFNNSKHKNKDNTNNTNNRNSNIDNINNNIDDYSIDNNGNIGTKFDFTIVDAINDLNNYNNSANDTNSNSNTNVNNYNDSNVNSNNNLNNDLSNDSDSLILNIISKIANIINNDSNNDSSKFKADYSNNLNHQDSSFLEKYVDFYKKVNLKVFIPVTTLIITAFFLLLIFIIGIEIAIMILLLIAMAIFLLIRMPKMKKESSYGSISNDFPYLLRQMVTELKSGKGLHDLILAIFNSDYGILSFEFSRVLEEIKYGENTENALIQMANRVKSDSLNMAVTQIIGTLILSRDLSNTLNIIADDVSREL